ncbi:MAG: glucokinase [Steroidobacteraceae bacterium]
MILVGDFGGTRTRLACADGKPGAWSISQLREYPTGGDAASLVRRYLADAAGPTPMAAAFCGAGPLSDDGSIRLTNADLALDPAALAAAAGQARVALINDFAAIGHAVPLLGPELLEPCGGGKAVRDAPRLVIGPGTGLGVAIAVPAAGSWTVIQGDGGHADLAPVDDEQLEAWRELRAARGRVAAETVLCGPGLERLHAVLSPGSTQGAEQIAEAAWRGEAGARRAVQMFTRWLGSVAGNLALTAGARGGVLIAGGIVPRWGRHFDAALFRAAFEAKPPYVEWLRAIPSFVVTHPHPGLLGLAALAGESLREPRR